MGKGKRSVSRRKSWRGIVGCSPSEIVKRVASEVAKSSSTEGES